MILSGLFALELSSRVYTLRAKSNAEAELWVKTLSKLRAQGAMSTLNPTGDNEHRDDIVVTISLPLFSNTYSGGRPQ